MLYRMVSDVLTCLRNHNYYTALGMTLMFPDICRKLDGNSRYDAWCGKYCENRDAVLRYSMEQGSVGYHILENGVCAYKHMNEPVLSYALVYELRHAYVHSGSTGLNKSHVYVSFHSSSVDGSNRVDYLQYDDADELVLADLDIWSFCEMMCRAVVRFYEAYLEQNDKHYQFVVIHEDDIEGDIFGRAQFAYNRLFRHMKTDVKSPDEFTAVLQEFLRDSSVVIDETGIRDIHRFRFDFGAQFAMAEIKDFLDSGGTVEALLEKQRSLRENSV